MRTLGRIFTVRPFPSRKAEQQADFVARCQAGTTVLLDCEWDEALSERETKNLVHQTVDGQNFQNDSHVTFLADTTPGPPNFNVGAVRLPIQGFR